MSDEILRVLLFSGDRTVREQVRLALGRKVRRCSGGWMPAPASTS